MHVPMGRLGERETMSEHDEEEDSYDEEIYETRSGRSGAYSGVGGAMGRRSGRSTGRRDRERERSGSRERSLSPRSDRRSHNLPPRPAKVTLVKSRKNEGEAQSVTANSGSGVEPYLSCCCQVIDLCWSAAAAVNKKNLNPASKTAICLF